MDSSLSYFGILYGRVLSFVGEERFKVKKKVLIIGSGPIVIGQACEFDYSGTQAVKALKKEGYEVILFNSNPATIMTDIELADRVYLEPLTFPYAVEIIKKERPWGLLPTVGGQTALNLTQELYKKGVLEKYEVLLLGASPDAIEKAESREKFKKAMEEIGLKTPRSKSVSSLEEGKKFVEEIGYPVILRPSFTLGGGGGSICYNQEELEEKLLKALQESPVNEVLIEESVLGWKEFELEVMRDKRDNVVIISSIENVDPMGIHTGDSITVAPQQTLSDKEYQEMRNQAIKIIRKIGVETGGSNIQFATHPTKGDIYVIEMNPRVSRSSALVSKATGFPIAKIAATLAVGKSLEEIPNDITKKTPACFEPTLDYIVVKIPRFTFEKFPETPPYLDTQMRSVGEVMAIGRTFPEAFQKAIRSLELGRGGWGKDFYLPEVLEIYRKKQDKELFPYLKEKLSRATDKRIFYIRYAMEEGMSIEEIYQLTHIDPWFLYQMYRIIEKEKEFLKKPSLEPSLLFSLKRYGFSDRQIAVLYLWEEIQEKISLLLSYREGERKFQEIYKEIEEKIRHVEREIFSIRKKEGVLPVYKRVDTCAAEFASFTPYLYSSYEEEDEAEVSSRKKVLILGSGPNRIGQGIEFDYCISHAAFSLKKEGIESIILNSNPETVSTDYDTSDRLYFEPITEEDVLHVIAKEKEKGEFLGVVVQLGGQTPLKLVKRLKEEGIKILGTSPDKIDLAEDRESFSSLLKKLSILQPPHGVAFTLEEACKVASSLGYPVLVRPSYVLGGRAMEIIYHEEELIRYIQENIVEISYDKPLLIDKFLENALEMDIDAIFDGEDIFICGILEHIEEAGVHSGDSACILPPVHIPKEKLQELEEITYRLAKALEVRGFINVQCALYEDKIYVLEVNPRASRTVPFIAKALGVPLVQIAMQVLIGKKLREIGYVGSLPSYSRYYVKEVVLPFKKFSGVDILLGPEMKSTGEVMGIGETPWEAYFKAQEAAGSPLPLEGVVFFSVEDRVKVRLLAAAENFYEAGFQILATQGTAKFLQKHHIPAEMIYKVHEGRPHVVDKLKSREIHLVINIPATSISRQDAREIRLTALKYNIPCITTPTAALWASRGILYKKKHPQVKLYPIGKDIVK